MSSPSEINTKISMDNDESDEISFSLAMRLARGSVLPMVLKATVELNLFELIKKAEPNDISASEIVAQLPTNNPDAANMVDRLLRLLAAHSVLNCTLTKTLPNHAGIERRYSLTPLCKFLTKNADGVSLAPTSILVQDKAMMESWYHLKDMILEGGIQFNGEYGTSVFEYSATDPRFNKIFNQAMSNHSTIVMKKILEIYKGFEGLNSLVDIGGGTGATINMIISKYPSTKGINFDLSHVVRDAPSYPGVEHIGGDMFVSVPKGDAIFMMLIIHAWNDEQSLKILKNCYEALPENGKVIIAEYIVSETSKSNGVDDACTVAITDIMMIVFSPGGKERTEEEFKALSKQAGFKEFKKVCCAHTMWIMELYK